MTPDEHYQSRMAMWMTVRACMTPYQTDRVQAADDAVADFDKRFPAPSAGVTYAPVTGILDGPPAAAAPVEPGADAHRDMTSVYQIAGPELASLRQKARLWDAVASGKVRLSVAGRAYCTWALGNEMTSLCDTAAEAVEAAIAAGALKL